MSEDVYSRLQQRLLEVGRDHLPLLVLYCHGQHHPPRVLEQPCLPQHKSLFILSRLAKRCHAPHLGLPACLPGQRQPLELELHCGHCLQPERGHKLLLARLLPETCEGHRLGLPEASEGAPLLIAHYRHRFLPIHILALPPPVLPPL